MGIFFDSLCLVISPMGILVNVTGVIQCQLVKLPS